MLALMTWWRDVIAALVVVAMVSLVLRQRYVSQRRRKREHARAQKRLEQDRRDWRRAGVVKLERRG